MAVPNNSRATDLGDILTVGTSGFTVRKRTGLGMFFHIFLLACMVLLGIALLVYYQSPKGCGLAIAIGASFALVAQNLEKQKQFRESLEFMNALFSSALGHGYAFCCIIKSSGDIVFYNRPFQTVFPAYIAQNTRTIASLMNLYHFPDEQRHALEKLMADNTQGNLTVNIRAAADSESRTTTFEIQPIERPTGFFLVRGK
jgi:hypothetical protein